MLTRQEKERLVLEQYNQGKTIRDIAKELRMSFRDIGAILKKASAEENENGQTTNKMEQHPALSVSAQSYKLFSEGKTPVEVAVSLNLPQPEVTQFYKEYWDLMKLQCLNKVYEDLGDDIGQFLKLYALCNSEGYDKKHVIELLRMADDNLQGFEYRYKLLKEEVAELERRNENLQKDIKNQEREIGVLKKIQNSYRLSSSFENRKLSILQNKRLKLEVLIKRFEGDNEEYNKIRRTAKDEVVNFLRDKKALLRIALISLTESLRNHSDKYNNFLLLLLRDNSPLQDHLMMVYKEMLLSEAEELYDITVNDLNDKIIEDIIYGM
jgi:predicted transcriptional regulator